MLPFFFLIAKSEEKFKGKILPMAFQPIIIATNEMRNKKDFLKLQNIKKKKSARSKYARAKVNKPKYHHSEGLKYFTEAPARKIIAIMQFRTIKRFLANRRRNGFSIYEIKL